MDQRVLAFLDHLAGHPQLDFDVSRFRAALERYLLFGGRRRAIDSVVDVAPDHGPRLRLYRSTSDPDQPVLVYLHGGAFVRGSLDAADVLCREVAWRGPCVVVSVDYRLAPDHPFPAAVEDAVTAFEWTRDNIARYGGGERVAVGGDSAGATLATVAARELGPAVAVQILLSGVYDLDDRLAGPAVIDVAADQRRLDWVARLYAGPEASLHDPRVSPLRHERFDGLPPTLMVSSELDPFLGQSSRYANALRAAGVAVDFTEYPGLIHGFVNLAGVFEEAYDVYEGVAAAVTGATVWT